MACNLLGERCELHNSSGNLSGLYAWRGYSRPFHPLANPENTSRTRRGWPIRYLLCSETTYTNSTKKPRSDCALPVADGIALTIGRGSPEPARWTPARCPSNFAHGRLVPSSALSSAPSSDRSSADSSIRTAATRQARHPTRPHRKHPHRCSGFGHPGTARPTAAYQVGALNPIPAPSRLTFLARFLSLHS